MPPALVNSVQNDGNPHCGEYVRHTPREILGSRLNTIHNLAYYQQLMAGMRDAIRQQALDDWIRDFYARRSQTP